MRHFVALFEDKLDFVECKIRFKRFEFYRNIRGGNTDEKNYKLDSLRTYGG